MDFSKTINGSILDKIGYKITIRTGEITADNGDGTYDVKIANADSAMPNIETLEYGATFSIREIVIVGFEYGCKESPKILGSTKKIAQEPKIVEVDYSGGARVKTLNAYSITETTTYLNGEISITANIIGNCTRRGFHYGTTTDYDSPDKYEDGSFGAGTYTLKIEGLTANTTYHYQAYVIDANGDEQVGEDKTLTTSVAPPSRYYALIVAYPNELRLFDKDGNLVKQTAIAGWSYAGCSITMDSQGNIYADEDWDVLRKYDSDLNVLVTKDIESGSNWFEGINIGSDGYLYTFEGRASGYAIAKRNITDLTIIEDIVALGGYYAGAICLDSDGNFYIYNAGDDKIEKRSNTGALLASLYVGYINSYTGFGVCGSNLYIAEGTDKIYYAPLDLSGYTEWDFPSPTDPAYSLTVADNHLILSGWGTGGVGATRKYDSSRNLIWEQFLGGSTYAYKAGGYNF